MHIHAYSCIFMYIHVYFTYIHVYSCIFMYIQAYSSIFKHIHMHIHVLRGSGSTTFAHGRKVDCPCTHNLSQRYYYLCSTCIYIYIYIYGSGQAKVDSGLLKTVIFRYFMYFNYSIFEYSAAVCLKKNIWTDISPKTALFAGSIGGGQQLLRPYLKIWENQDFRAILDFQKF